MDGIPSQPGLLLLRELIIFITSVYSICRIAILLGMFCRKSCGFKLVINWMAANVGPIYTKWLLNSFTIRSSFSMILLFIIKRLFVWCDFLLLPITDFIIFHDFFMSDLFISNWLLK